MRGMAIVIVLLFIGSILALSGSVSAAEGGIHIEGPTWAATETKVKYRVYIDEPFEKYKCTMLLAGRNLTGAEPLNEVTKTSTNGSFEFEVTTPKVPQTVYISFKLYGINGDKIRIFERKISLYVLRPLPIKVKLKNPNEYDIQNVELKFYVDGDYIGNMLVDKVKANSTKSVTYNWLPQNLQEGKHTLRIEIATPGIVFGNGKNIYSYQFYYGKPPSYDYIYYSSVGILVVLAGMLVFTYLSRKGRKTMAAPKWRK